jgi:hypothetical protein
MPPRRRNTLILVGLSVLGLGAFAVSFPLGAVADRHYSDAIPYPLVFPDVQAALVRAPGADRWTIVPFDATDSSGHQAEFLATLHRENPGARLVTLASSRGVAFTADRAYTILARTFPIRSAYDASVDFELHEFVPPNDPRALSPHAHPSGELVRVPLPADDPEAAGVIRAVLEHAVAQPTPEPYANNPDRLAPPVHPEWIGWTTIALDAHTLRPAGPEPSRSVYRFPRPVRAQATLDGAVLVLALMSLLAPLALAILIARFIRARHHRSRVRRRVNRGLCPACAYDRRGTSATAPCPECGRRL